MTGKKKHEGQQEEPATADFVIEVRISKPRLSKKEKNVSEEKRRQRRARIEKVEEDIEIGPRRGRRRFSL